MKLSRWVRVYKITKKGREYMKQLKAEEKAEKKKKKYRPRYRHARTRV